MIAMALSSGLALLALLDGAWTPAAALGLACGAMAVLAWRDVCRASDAIRSVVSGARTER